MPRAPGRSPSSSAMSVASKGSCAPPSSARRAPSSAARCGRCPPGSRGHRRALLTPTPTRRTTRTLEITPDLVRRLKRLRLGGLLPTLPDRRAPARRAKLSHLECLEPLLQDEIDRRNSHGLAPRLAAAGFHELVS